MLSLLPGTSEVDTTGEQGATLMGNEGAVPASPDPGPGKADSLGGKMEGRVWRWSGDQAVSPADTQAHRAVCWRVPLSPCTCRASSQFPEALGRVHCRLTAKDMVTPSLWTNLTLHLPLAGFHTWENVLMMMRPCVSAAHHLNDQSNFFRKMPLHSASSKCPMHLFIISKRTSVIL